MNNFTIVAAIGKNNELGKNNQLLWHISDDLKRFKSLTFGHTVIMGRKTFESLKNGPLTNRRNIVMTNNLIFKSDRIEVVHNLDDLSGILNPNEEVFVIGGAQIYELLLPFTQILYLTLIHQSYDADVYFPKINLKEWLEVERFDISNDIKAGVNYSFVKFEKK